MKIYHLIHKGWRGWQERLLQRKPASGNYQYPCNERVPHHCVELFSNTVVFSNLELQDLTRVTTMRWPEKEALLSMETSPMLDDWARSIMRQQKSIDRKQAALRLKQEQLYRISRELQQRGITNKQTKES